ncbi:MAG TPA: hypothetical protein VJJ83_00355, partial [Candidatus Babeliales bacterium]|nr:hypothetical protein [Candidatus Babeliales bacterium]
MERKIGAAMLNALRIYPYFKSSLLMGILLSLSCQSAAQELLTKLQAGGEQVKAAAAQFLDRVGLSDQPFTDPKTAAIEQQINQNLLEAVLVDQHLSADERKRRALKLLAGPLRPPTAGSILRVPTPPANIHDALWHAAHTGNLPLAQAAEQLGADINYRKGGHGSTPIWTAVQAGYRALAADDQTTADCYQAVAQFLRDLGADESFRPAAPAKKLREQQLRVAYQRRLDQNQGILV